MGFHCISASTFDENLSVEWRFSLDCGLAQCALIRNLFRGAVRIYMYTCTCTCYAKECIVFLSYTVAELLKEH